MSGPSLLSAFFLFCKSAKTYSERISTGFKKKLWHHSLNQMLDEASFTSFVISCSVTFFVPNFNSDNVIYTAAVLDNGVSDVPRTKH